MKTSELTGRKLDYAVALAAGLEPEIELWIDSFAVVVENKTVKAESVFSVFSPSISWSQGGPLIEEYKIALLGSKEETDWTAGIAGYSNNEWGSTPLEAAMRALVAYKLGPEVSIPEELEE